MRLLAIPTVAGLLSLCLAGCFWQEIPMPRMNSQVDDEALRQLSRAGKLRFLPGIGRGTRPERDAHITTLDLSDSRITDAGLQYLQGLTSLRKIELTGTRVTDAGLESLKGLTSLTSIELYRTSVTGAGLEHLMDLPDLGEIRLTNGQLTDEVFRVLGSHRKIHLLGRTGRQRVRVDSRIESLNLVFAPLSDAGLVHLKGLRNLRTLHLDRTRVTDAGLIHLSQLTSLRWLVLSETAVTRDGIRKLQESLPECRIVRR